MKKYLVDVKKNGDVVIGDGIYMYISGDNIQQAVDKNINKIVQGQRVPSDIHIIEYPKTAEIERKEETVIGVNGEKQVKKWYIAKMTCKVSTGYTKDSELYQEFEKEFFVRILDENNK